MKVKEAREKLDNIHRLTEKLDTIYDSEQWEEMSTIIEEVSYLLWDYEKLLTKVMDETEIKI